MKALISFIVSRLETVCFQARVKLAPPHLELGGRVDAVGELEVRLVEELRVKVPQALAEGTRIERRPGV